MNAQATSRDLFDNPLGTDGFEFVEFTAPEPDLLKGLFEKMGFTAVSRHRSKSVIRMRQGDINFLLNMEPSGSPRTSARFMDPQRTPWPSGSRTPARRWRSPLSAAPSRCWDRSVPWS